jgi:hypothetical protein
MPSPFKHGKAGLHPDIHPRQYKSVVIRCIIDSEERVKVAMLKAPLREKVFAIAKKLLPAINAWQYADKNISVNIPVPSAN